MLQSTQAGGLSLSALPSLMLLYGYKVTYATTFKAVSGAKEVFSLLGSIYEVRKTLPGALPSKISFMSRWPDWVTCQLLDQSLAKGSEVNMIGSGLS